MMTLNKQLFIVSLLLLSIPWSGCQYLQEIDASLRSGQEQTLRASSQVIATVLAQNPSSLQLNGADASSNANNITHHDASNITPTFYCHPMAYLIEPDGYNDEWPDINWSRWPDISGSTPKNNAPVQIRYRCAVHKDQLMLFFEINNNEMRFNNPNLSLANNGDRLVLVVADREYILTAVAPGKITPRYLNSAGITYRESLIDASLIDNGDSYQIEISMPRALTKGQLSFYVIDESDYGRSRLGPQAADSITPELIFQSDGIKARISSFVQSGQRLRLLNPQGWMLASSGSLDTRNSSTSHWLLQKFYRALLAERYQEQPTYIDGINFFDRQEFKRAAAGQSSATWYKNSLRANHHILTHAEPIFVNDNVVAILLAEQSSEQTASLTDQAFNRLFSLSILIMGGATLALLAYASWLSWRIRQLSTATQNALDQQGQISRYYPQSNASDEIGVLTRNYGELMKRIGDYTDYLQTLSRKLSHELRTPLAIIHSSLDNLETQPLDKQSLVYQQRAKEGALRLGNIITAMSEANRVEESIQHSELEATDLVALLTELSAAYGDLYPRHIISFDNVDNQPALELWVAPDLLVQMLDKLIDNAASFCPADGHISLRLSQQKNTVLLAISNDGPLLPETMQNQLFDNMVSLREERNNDSTHLGLGLYIVSLIVNFHGGSIAARNRDDNKGVVFSISLPVT
ncbi:MAG: dedicated sortase system histidine kinase [Oceanicoccus sp.]|jgi:dedicated sortase system histidine kinase